MFTFPNPRQERSSTYIVQDRSNGEELTRIQIQDELITLGMGGVLSEQPDPASFQLILDVGCGSGGWLIETAKVYPHLTKLMGVDISHSTVAYANQQATLQQVDDRVEFRTMDALHMMEFADQQYDLVNQRYGLSYLRAWDWPKILREFRRVTRQGGVVRLTECGRFHSNSAALECFADLLTKAGHQAGLLFSPDQDSVITQLAPLLRQHGFEQVQSRTYDLEYRAGTPQGEAFAQTVYYASRTFLPFIRKWTQLPANYEEIQQQALQDMQQPDFAATWKVVTTWGINPL